MGFTDVVDEVAALVMILASVLVLVAGAYTNAIGMVSLSVEDLLLIGAALMGPAAGYLFGKKHTTEKPKA